MTRSVELLRVFVSGPSDVAAEKVAAKEVVDAINRYELAGKPVQLQAVMFETDVAPGFGGEPQDVVDAQLGLDFDIYVGVLRDRFGTPTGAAGSGTEQEFGTAYDRWREDRRSCCLLIYFGESVQTNRDRTTKSVQQLLKVMQFRDRVSGLGGLYHPYGDVGSFKDSLRNHLVRVLNNYGSTWGPEADDAGRDHQLLIPSAEETTTLDAAADAEEAMEAIAASLGRMNEANQRLSQDFQSRTAEANSLLRLAGVSPRRARGLMRAAAGDIDAARNVLATEMPALMAEWSTFKDSMFVIIAKGHVEDEADRVAVEEVHRSLDAMFNSTSGTLASVRTFRETVGGMQGNRDLNRAAQEMEAALDLMGQRFETIMAEVRDIQGGLSSMP